jgi:hypothetical protein
MQENPQIREMIAAQQEFINPQQFFQKDTDLNKKEPFFKIKIPDERSRSEGNLSVLAQRDSTHY